MPKVIIYGYLKDAQKSDKTPDRIDREYEIEADVTEQEIAELVLRKLQAGGRRFFRSKADRQAGKDRISLVAGIDTDTPVSHIEQPRDPTTGRFISYEAYGRLAAQEAGISGALRDPTTGRYISYATYGKQKHQFVTGSARPEFRGLEYLEKQLEELL